MIFLSSYLPIPLVITGSGDCLSWNVYSSQEASIKRILYSDYPWFPFRIKSASEYISSGIYEEIVISEIMKYLSREIGRISLPHSSEIKPLVLFKDYLSSAYPDFREIGIWFSFLDTKFIFHEIFAVSYFW